MTDPLIHALSELLERSVGIWRIDGTVSFDSTMPGQIRISSDGAELLVSRAPVAMPFRWVVTANGRRRTAASITGVLRIVRQSLVADYEPFSLTIAALPENRA